MLIGLISDVHDRTRNLLTALDRLQALGCGHLLFLGDMATTDSLHTLCEHWQGELDMVLGNCDYPESAFLAAAARYPHVRHHGEAAELELDSRCIFMAHSPELALRAADFAPFDAVFFGHTHRAGQQRRENRLIANPGDLQGRFGAPSFAVYDTTAHALNHYLL